MPADPIGGQLILQAALIAVNAFFAAAEIAVISLNENKLRHQAEEGDAKAKQMLRFVEQPAGFLSTIQIAITLAGFLGSAFAAENFSDRLVSWLVGLGATIPRSVLDTLCVVGITLILSYFTLVFGELVPKRIAMQKTEKVARLVSGVVYFISLVVKPVVWLLSISTNGVLRLLRIDPNAQEEAVTEEEIRMMVDIGEEKGAIESEEKEMIENIFEFNNSVASDVMTHRTDVTALSVDDTPETILETIKSTGLSRYPVYREDMDDIVGVLNARDYLINQVSSAQKPMESLLREPYFVPETVHTDVLFRDMQQKKIHLAIVVDEYGGTSGLVTMEDLLEEIVGNIYDEFDPLDVQELALVDDNLWRVSGSIDLETLSTALGVDLPESDDYDTLGGLVFSQLSAIPQDGSHPEVDIGPLHIRVEELTDRRVEWALVTLTPEQENTLAVKEL